MRSTTRCLLYALALTLVAAASPGVRADEPAEPGDPAPAATDVAPPEPETPKPWAEGVSEAERAAAFERFDQGNQFFERSQYSKALSEYKRAVEHWDHPAIRFNMVVCLIELGNLVSAWHSLRRSLYWGRGPLSARNHQEALRYEKMLNRSVAFVKITCAEPDAVVTLDGKAVLTGPGEVSRVMMPGEVQIVASKPGFMTLTRTQALIAGPEIVVELDLLPLTAATKQVRRWPAAVPWSVLGGGLAVGLIGIPLYLMAKDDYAAYDKGVAGECSTSCLPSQLEPETRDFLSQADTEYHASIVLFATGGAAVATGVVLLLMNQPRTVEVQGAVEVEPPTEALNVVPIRGGALLNAELTF